MAAKVSFYRRNIVPLLTEFTSQFMITFWGSMAMKPYGNGNSEVNGNHTTNNDCCTTDSEYFLHVFMPAFQSGLSVWMMITVFWKISGAHFNPAISLGFVVAGLLRPIMFVPYVIFQCLGSIVAAAAAKAILGENPGIIAIPETSSTAAVFLNEFIMVGLVIFCALPVCADEKYDQQTGALAIGMTIFQGILSARWVGTIGISPSRVIGPAVIVGGKAWDRHWLFWISDLCGGVFAACYYMALFAPPNKCWIGKLRRRMGHESNTDVDTHELGVMVDDEEKH